MVSDSDFKRWLLDIFSKEKVTWEILYDKLNIEPRERRDNLFNHLIKYTLYSRYRYVYLFHEMPENLKKKYQNINDTIFINNRLIVCSDSNNSVQKICYNFCGTSSYYLPILKMSYTKIFNKCNDITVYVLEHRVQDSTSEGITIYSDTYFKQNINNGLINFILNPSLIQLCVKYITTNSMFNEKTSKMMNKDVRNFFNKN